MVSPSLSPWILGEAKPIPVTQPIDITMSEIVAAAHELHQIRDREREGVTGGRRPLMEHRPSIVATNNLGNISATFRIPGHINVPSDFQQHNVTISSFEFKVPYLWYTFPKANARVYMEVGFWRDISFN